MIVYAESSAVLTWLLGEKGEREVRELFGGAERVVSSTLTSVECARALARGRTSGRVSPTEELAALALLDKASESWTTLDMTGHVLDLARAAFPQEPVRALDAIHLATAVLFNETGAITVVSLDDRIRSNAELLGMKVAP